MSISTATTSTTSELVQKPPASGHPRAADDGSNTETPEVDPDSARRLWSKVITLALKDLKYLHKTKDEEELTDARRKRRNEIRGSMHPLEFLGSDYFEAVCELVGIHADAVRDRVDIPPDDPDNKERWTIDMQEISTQLWPKILDHAEESVLIAAPALREPLLDKLFSLSRPIEVKLVTSREALAEHPADRDIHAKQVQDINHDIEIRVVDREVPPCMAVDHKHVVCDTDARSHLELARSVGPEAALSMIEEIWEEGEPYQSDMS